MRVASFFRGASPACLFLCLLYAPLSAADLPVKRIPDDSSLRVEIKDTWFTEAPARVLGRRPLVRTLQSGERIQVRTEEGGKEFAVVLAREWNGSRESLALVQRQTGAAWPGWTQGSWSLTRLKSTGEVLRIRIFLRSDPNAYIQFRPFTGDKCLMDVIIHEAYLVDSLPLPVPFERLYTLPVEEALDLAGNRFPRRYFEPDPGDYEDVRHFISAVRGRLSELSFRDDGAIDENGRHVFIESLDEQDGNGGLNCSGFAKWLVDGILRPVTGKRLAVGPLKQRFGDRGSSFTEMWEEIRDPFFGLDWIRNLASSVWTELRGESFGTLEEFEVRRWPFSQTIIRERPAGSPRSYPGHLENAGFGIEGLQPLLYTLAIDEPGRIYLAAVNTETGPPATADNLRGRPRMRQYFHVAALVPYFNRYGNFQIVVFESAEETRFNSFKTRYPGHYVNLVRIPVERIFNP
ncbi:MAG: hypothetical protein LBI86_09625 [Treponema sp.]|nr:hypothetical protein [Treponema sp.]